MQPLLFATAISAFIVSLVAMTLVLSFVAKKLSAKPIAGDNIHKGAFNESLVNRLVRRFTTWRENQKAIRELHSVPDEVLRDLGIERREIEARVRYSSRRPLPFQSHGAPNVATLELPRAA